MKVSRRKSIQYGIFSISTALIPTLLIAATESKDDWQHACRHWIRTLLPPDANGPGADTKEMWQRLTSLFEQKPDTQRWIIMGFDQLAKTKLPKTDDDIAEFFIAGSPFANLLDFFQDFLLEQYYGSNMGWHDLGILDPPQPKGFDLYRD